MKRWGFLLAVALGLGVFLGTTSCATQTTLDTSWHVPLTPGQSFHKLVVIGLLRSPVKSKAFETAVVNRFAAAGVQAIPSYSIMKEDIATTKKEMVKAVDGTGADGVLIFKMIAIDKSKHYVPPTEYDSPVDSDVWWDDPYWGYYNPYPYHYWGYWYPGVQVVTTPGYWEKETAYRVEACLYRASDGKLVWVADSSTYNPEGNADLASSISKVVLSDLTRNGLIESKRV